METAPVRFKSVERGVRTEARNHDPRLDAERVAHAESTAENAVGREIEGGLTEAESGAYVKRLRRLAHTKMDVLEGTSAAIQDHFEPQGSSGRRGVRPRRPNEQQEIRVAAGSQRLEHVPVRRPAKRGGERAAKTCSRSPPKGRSVNRQVGQRQAEEGPRVRARTDDPGEPAARDDVVVSEDGQRAGPAHEDQDAAASPRRPVNPAPPGALSGQTAEQGTTLPESGLGNPHGRSLRRTAHEKQREHRKEPRSSPEPGARPLHGGNVRRLSVPPEQAGHERRDRRGCR